MSSLQQFNGQGPSLRFSALSMIGETHSVEGGAAIARRHISAITDGRCCFSVRNPRHFKVFRSAQAGLGRSRVQVLQWDGETECQTITERSPREGVVFHLVLNGQFDVRQGDRHATVREGELLAISAPGTVERHWQGRCDLLNLVVPQATLTNSLADNGKTPGEIAFDALAPAQFSAIPTVVSILQAVVADLASRHGVFAASPLAAQAERMMALLLLKSLPHRALQATVPTSRIAPFYVRRAERHLQENLAEDITMGALAAATGVSERTLYYGFKTYRRLTPMRHLRNLRLDRARSSILLAEAPSIRIKDVAASVGYTSASQFSRDYKERHGETPCGTMQSKCDDPRVSGAS